MNPDIQIDEPVSMSMNPYTGAWTRAEAAHLLRRTLIGPTFQQIQDAVSNGMNATIASLLTPSTVNPPLTYDPQEAVATFGNTWVTSVYPAGDSNPTDNARRKSLFAWLMQNLNTNSLSITEKMTLFWQNHFAVESQFDSRSSYDYVMLLRDNCLGNVIQLVKDVTINPEMLLFLNGASNNVYSPNENFSRELLELFTVGKGPQIGPGDYTNYTEADIAAGAKVLTGWKVNGLRSTTLTAVQSAFQPSWHDNTTKQFSGHFGNSTIAGNGAQEYSDYIDLIYQQPACADFLCRKLYRFFVNYDLTTDVETNVIPVMAATLIANNYDILPVLEELLKSEHFYDFAFRGSVIRNPIENFLMMMNSSNTVPNYDLATNYEMYLNVYWWISVQGQNYFAPPNVGGWPAYYQSPSFTKLWLNSTYLKQRFDISIWLTAYGGLTVNGNKYKVNALQLVDGLSYPSGAIEVIDDLCDLYFPKPVTSLEKTTLKNILTNGLPDFEWTMEYNDYQNNPGNTLYSDPVKQRVELVIAQMFRMAQYQTL